MDPAPAAPPSHLPVAVLVKLGGAAITDKQQLETLNAAVLLSCAHLLAALHRQLSSPSSSSGSRPGSSGSGGDADGAVDGSQAVQPGGGARLVIVHGAGSFGHQQAASSGVAGGGIHASPAVRAGFAATRASVTRLNHSVVAALLAAGVPAVGLSPCGSWTTCNREVVADGCEAVAALLAAGLVPVLHGDAVLDAVLGCTILSGDVIITRLCQRFRPPVVAFLTNVDGIYDRPPEQPGAQLISLIEVNNSSSDTSGSGSGSGREGDADGANGGTYRAFAELGKEVMTLQTNAAAHDTTGGVATKIREAAAVARLGAEVRIARAGGPAAEAACSSAPTPVGWRGTRVRC